MSFLGDPIHYLLHRRIGRLGFVIGYASTAVVVMAFPYILGLARSHEQRFAIAAALVTFLIAASICLPAWRCHDFGKSAWDNFWTDQIPIIGSVWALFELLFIAGDKQRNGYGDPPTV
jgi:uncharacterized membrane protein YhaH (DUF805 family)